MIMTKVRSAGADLFRTIDDYIEQSRFEELLVIVPTNRRARQLKREFTASSKNKAIHSIHIETLQTLTTKILVSAGIKLNIVNDPTSHVLLRQCFKETDLPYLKNKKQDLPTGSRQRLRYIFSELKRQGISSSDILRSIDADSPDYEQRKAKDIGSLYAAYEKKLETTAYIESGSLFQLISTLDIDFKAHFEKIFTQVNLIIVNGYSEFSTPEVEIINSLSELEGTDLYLNFDYFERNYQLFGSLQRCYDLLAKKGFSVITDLSPSAKNYFLDFIKQKLFKEKPHQPVDDFKDMISLIKGNSPREEVLFIAKEIKHLLTEENTDPASVCVVFNLIEQYSPVIRDVFTSYGIPFNLTDRPFLSTAPAVIALMNFLEIQSDDYYYKTLFNAFDNDIIPLDACSLHDLILVAEKLRIISGYTRWTDAVQLLNQAQEVNSKPSFNDVERAKRCVKAIMNIQKQMTPLQKDLTPQKFYVELEKLVIGFRMHEKFLTYAKEDAEYSISAITTFLATVKELCDLFEMEFGKNKTFTFSYFIRQIKNTLLVTRYTIREKQGYGVLITTPDEIRGFTFDHFFIGGLYDGNFPTRYTPEVFAPGSFAKNDRQHLLENQYLFYQMLSVFRKKLYLSYPSADNKKDLMPSSFLTSLLSICSVPDKNRNVYESSLYSQYELLHAIGHHGAESFSKDDLSVFPHDFASLFSIDTARRSEHEAGNDFKGIMNSDNLPEKAKEKLQHLREIQYSISQLETYAKCPFKYFSERVMKLTFAQEPQEEADRMEIGSLLHSILYDFSIAAVKENIVLRNCSGEVFEQAKGMLFAIAKQQLETTQAGQLLPFWDKEKILGIAGDEQQSILYKFLEQERNSVDLQPALFETPFGTFSREEGKEDEYAAIEIDGIKLRGKIDRIDVNHEKRIFRVYDYKLSGNDKITKDIQRGIALQLPVYLIAGTSILKEEYGDTYAPYLPAIYSLQYAAKKFGPEIANKPSSKYEDNVENEDSRAQAIEKSEEMMAFAGEKIKEYVNGITGGEFYLSTLYDRDDKVCKYCEFQKICRVKESCV